MWQMRQNPSDKNSLHNQKKQTAFQKVTENWMSNNLKSYGDMHDAKPEHFFFYCGGEDNPICRVHEIATPQRLSLKKLRKKTKTGKKHKANRGAVK